MFLTTLDTTTTTYELFDPLELFGATFRLLTGSPSAIRWETDPFGSPPRLAVVRRGATPTAWRSSGQPLVRPPGPVSSRAPGVLRRPGDGAPAATRGGGRRRACEVAPSAYSHACPRCRRQAGAPSGRPAAAATVSAGGRAGAGGARGPDHRLRRRRSGGGLARRPVVARQTQLDLPRLRWTRAVPL